MKRPFSYDHHVTEWASGRRVDITLYDATSTRLTVIYGKDNPARGLTVDEALALADMVVKASWGSVFRRAWYRFLAWSRIDRDLVCALSRNKGLVDYHDYPDTEDMQPVHFGTLKCERCGKEFSI